MRWHIERSDDGLCKTTDAALDSAFVVVDATDAARALAKPGRDYVLEHYTWPVTLDRMEATLDEWLPA